MKHRIEDQLELDDNEIEMHAIRAQGAGGQNVNKVSSAVHLRFDIAASSLPDDYKERLLAVKDRRISKEGIIVIKAQTARSQEQNRQLALERLLELLRRAASQPKPRRATKPSRGMREKRLEQKHKQAETKSLRRRIDI